MTKLMKLIDTYKYANVLLTTLERQTELDKARAAVVEAVEKLEKDAARYRWLREADQTTAIHLTHYAFDALDTAIDAAMEATK